MNSDQTPSDNTAPDDINLDKSLEFRRCWALGEAYYFLENNYGDCFKCKVSENPFSKDIRDYKSNLMSVRHICDELNINNQDMDIFIDNLHKELNNISKYSIDVPKGYKSSKYGENKFRDFSSYFEIELEGYIIGSLKGKDPRYNHIFRIAKHSLELYKNPGDNEDPEDKFNNFLTDLENIKNFVSRDKIALIRETILKWPKVSKNYMDDEYDNDLKYGNIKRPDLIEIVNKIGGLITGSVEVHDVLNRRDRTVWAVVSYGSFIFPAVLIGIIIWSLNLNFSSLYHYMEIGQLNNYLIIVSALAGAFLSVIRASIPLWRKFADWFGLKLAIKRLKDPHKYLIISPWSPFEKHEYASDKTQSNEIP